jgi:probable HAF family extracellular repeat protein
MKHRHLILLTILLAALWPSAATAQSPINSFTVVETGFNYALNDAGNLAGEYSLDEWTTHACLTAGEVFTDLGSLGGSYSSAHGINNHNQVVGWSSLAGEEDSHAFLWDLFTGMKDLGTLGGQNSSAVAINDSGQVVGTSDDAGGYSIAFLWQNGQMVPLPPPAGFLWSEARGINASGQVVGTVHDFDGLQRPFRWTPHVPNGTTGTMVLLETATNGQGAGINDAGDVVGSRGGVAALWSSTGGPAFTLPGTWTASSINNSGMVVGTGSYPFFWDAVNGTRDLNRMADLSQVGLQQVFTLNASGQILAVRWDYGFFLLTPSPIPSRPFNLLDSGVGGLNLTWSASYGATEYNVKRWSGTSYTTVANVNATTYRETSVPNSQANLYVVSAVNSYGESGDSDPAFTLPAPPTNLAAATGKGKASISLKWTHSTSFGIVQYRIYRSTTNGSGYALRATVGQVNSFVDTGLASRTTYYYVVTSVNSSGRESAYSNQASARTR